MGYKNHESRHIFLAIGVLIGLLSPLFLAFLPHLVANIFHYKNGVWNVFAPGENFIAFGIGFFFLFVASMVLFLMGLKRKSLVISCMILLLSLSSFYVGAQSYKILADDSISYRPILTSKERTYNWEDVEKIVRIDYVNEGYNEYEFCFTDGESLKLKNSNYFRQIRNKFDRKVKELDIAIESVKIEE